MKKILMKRNIPFHSAEIIRADVGIHPLKIHIPVKGMLRSGLSSEISLDRPVHFPRGLNAQIAIGVTADIGDRKSVV